jgi:hypothetical protein
MAQSWMVRPAGILAIAGILLACGDGDGEAEAGPPPSAETSTTTEPPTVSAETPETTEGVVTLTAVGDSGVSGEAALRWSPGASVLDVTIQLVGVDEGATYASMIAPGCGPGAGHVHTLGNGVGAADGTLTITAEIPDVDRVEFDGGWAIKVARPPAGPQACGAVSPA